MKPAGYRCYHSGKWHIDGPVLAAGFDRSYRSRNQGNFFTDKGNLVDDRSVKPEADESGFYATDRTAEFAIECLQEHAQSHRDQPFLSIPSRSSLRIFPLHAPQEAIDKYRDRYVAGWEALRKQRYEKQREFGMHSTPLSELEPDVGPPYHFPEALKKLGPNEVNRPVPLGLTD